MSRQEERAQSSLIPQLQAEIDVRDADISSLHSELSVLDSRYKDVQAKLEEVQKQASTLKEEYEKKVVQAQESAEKKDSVEMMTLREANENLKVLLNGAETKYMRISNLNLELQKKIDQLEQQSRMTMDQV